MIPLRDDVPSRGRPRIVHLLIGANILGFLLQVLAGPALTEALALKPAFLLAWWDGETLQLLREVVGPAGQRARAIEELAPGLLEGPIPLISSQFLHAGLIHLGSNLLFLWIFADNIEGEIGSGAFLVFYLLCGVLAGLCHVYFEPDSVIPTIGASGAIAGVLGAYFVRFPHARVLTLVPIFFFPFLVEIPAVTFLGLWFLLQVLYGLTDTGGNLAVWAHAGGFVAGLVLISVLPRVKRRGPGPRYRAVRYERTR